MKISDIILNEGYREAVQAFVSSADDSTVKSTVNAFKELVNKNQVAGDEKNIDYWRQRGWDEFSEFVNAKLATPTKTAVKRGKVGGKSVTIADTDEWLIVVPLDKNSSCQLGRGSDWCTAKPNQQDFEKYFYKQHETLIYCINKSTGGMWAVLLQPEWTGEIFFDKNDNQIDREEFEQQTGLDYNNDVFSALTNRLDWSDVADAMGIEAQEDDDDPFGSSSAPPTDDDDDDPFGSSMPNPFDEPETQTLKESVTRIRRLAGLK